MKSLYSKNSFFYLLLILAIGTNHTIAQTIVKPGIISGIWTKQSSPYIIKGDLNVPVGRILTIQSGVKVKFAGPYIINIQGSLIAIGTSKDSIVFTMLDTTGIIGRMKLGWNGIRFDRRTVTWDTIKFKMQNDEVYRKMIEPRIKSKDLDTATKINLVLKIPDAVNDTILADSVFSTKQGSQLSYCRFEYSTSEAKAQPYVFGGAIYIYRYSNLLINNCIFENNNAYAGGAIYCKEAAPILLYNKILKCKAQSSGGAMVFIHSAPVVMNNTITDNVSGYNGGAILFYESSPYVLNNIFLRNKAVNSGGAVFCEQKRNPYISTGKYSPVANVRYPRDVAFDKINLNTLPIQNTNSFYGRFINNIICDNKAATGGGMALFATAPEFTNITLSNNKADTAGGGIYCELSSPRLTNSIINGNVKSQVYMVGESLPEFSYCDVESGISGIKKDSTCKSTLSFSNITSLAPKFNSPTGGDYSLGAGSECIDAGTPDTTSLKLPKVDQSGKNRVVNGRIDLGALEYAGSKTTQKSTEENDKSNETIPDEAGEMFTCIFPNPTCGSFSLVMHNNLYESVTVTVYSQTGQIVYINNFKTEKWFEKQIDLTGFPKGVYIIMIHSDKSLLYNEEIIIE
jgi:predicted outer membrane repeat protein